MSFNLTGLLGALTKQGQSGLGGEGAPGGGFGAPSGMELGTGLPPGSMAGGVPPSAQSLPALAGAVGAPAQPRAAGPAAQPSFWESFGDALAATGDAFTEVGTSGKYGAQTVPGGGGGVANAQAGASPGLTNLAALAASFRGV